MIQVINEDSTEEKLKKKRFNLTIAKTRKIKEPIMNFKHLAKLKKLIKDLFKEENQNCIILGIKNDFATGS